MAAIERLCAIVVIQVQLVPAYDSQRLAVGVIEGDVIVSLLAHPAHLQSVVVGIQIMVRDADYLVNRE